MASVYTRRGDTGTTSLASGERVSKDDPRIELLGCLDELNAFIGLARTDVVDSDVDDVLGFLQHRLFTVGGAAAGSTTRAAASAEDVTALEDAIDRFTAKGGGFEGFVLPGCDVASGRLDVARAAARRAERAAVAAARATTLDPQILAFLNRASDLLFVAARYVGAGNECYWDPDAPLPHQPSSA